MPHSGNSGRHYCYPSNMDILWPTRIEFAIGNMISDQYLVIFRERISLTPIHPNKISCSDRPTVVHSRTLP